MKTLQQIKEEYAKELDNGSFESWSCYREYNEIHEEDLGIIAQRYADECAREALRLASENINSSDYRHFDSYFKTIKSVLSDINLPSHISSKELDEDIKEIVDKNFDDLL